MITGIRRHPITFLRTNPCATLLFAQLLGVLIYPFLEGSAAGRALIAVFGLVVLGLALLAVRQTPTLTWVGVVLAIPAVVLLLVQMVTDDADLAPYSSAFEAALYFYAAFSLLRYMLADDKVTTDELFAVGAVFTVIAWAFAHLYVVVQAIYPESFIAFENRQGPADLERPALPVVHDALEHRALRHPAGQAARPERGDVRAGGGRLLPGDGGHPPDRAVRDAQATAVTALHLALSRGAPSWRSDCWC